MRAPWEIEAIATHTPRGTSERHVCPKCLGGSDKEASLSVYVDQDFNFHWRCYRSTCGYKGGRSHDGQFVSRSKAPAKEPRFYTRPTVYPSSEQHALIQARFGLEPGTVSKYSDIDDRFILEVRSSDQYTRGYVAYSLSGATPKSLTYNEAPNYPFMHVTGRGGLVVVVEDWFSAEKVASAGAAGATGAAIMGTNLTEDMVDELVSLDSPVVLALDKDAWTKSIKYQQKYKERFKHGLTVWRLDKDLKYVSVERIIEAVNGKTYFVGDSSQPGVL